MVKEVYAHGAVLVEDIDMNRYFKVNSQRLKVYHGGVNPYFFPFKFFYFMFFLLVLIVLIPFVFIVFILKIS